MDTINKLACLVLRKKIDNDHAIELIKGPEYRLVKYLNRTAESIQKFPPSLVRYSNTICNLCNIRTSSPSYIVKLIGRRTVCINCTDKIRCKAQLRMFRWNYTVNKNTLVKDRVMSLWICRLMKYPWIIGRLICGWM